MHRLGAVLLFLFLAALVTPGSAKAISLNEAWAKMQQADPALKASRELINESKGHRMSALSPLLPRVSGEVQIRHFTKEEGFVWDSGSLGLGVIPFPSTQKTVPQYSAGVEQLIFDSGKSILGYKASNKNVEAARLNVYAYSQERAINLIKIYSTYYLSQKYLEVAEKAALALAEHERVAHAMHEQQLVPKTDVLTAEVAASKAGLDVTEARDNMSVARKNLSMLIGEDPTPVEEPLVAPPTKMSADPNERPEIKAKAAESKAAKLEAVKEGLSYMPEFVAKANAAYIDDEYRLYRDQYTFWGGVRWPIFDGSYHLGQRRSALARSRRSQYEKEALQNSFAVELEDARRAWSRSSTEISVAQQNKAKAAQNLKDAEIAYKEQMVSALDVRDAVRLWTEATYNYYEAICKKQLAAAKLRQASGEPIFETGGNQ